MARRAALKADLAAAQERFAGRIAVLELGDEDDESVSLEFGGACYAVFPGEAYPQGLSQVFGDDREWQLPGSLEAVVAELLRLRGAGEEEEEDSDADSTLQLEVESPQAPGIAAGAADGGFAALVADVSLARELFGEQAAEASFVGGSCRLVLRLDPTADGCLDGLTAAAWGIDTSQPIVVRLLLNAEEDVAAALPTLRVYQGETWERGPAAFAPSKQLSLILSDFLRERSARTSSPQTKGRPGKRLRAAPDEGEVNPLGGEHWAEAASSRAAELRRRKDRDVAEVLDSGGSVVLQLLRYMPRRLAGLHEYCAICDQPHAQPAMLQRTVCGRTLCSWQFAQFGSLISDAMGLNSTAEVLDLLVCMAIHAARSSRNRLLFEPFPTLFGKDGSEPKLSAKSPDRFERLATVMRELEAVRKLASAEAGANWTQNLELLEAQNELARPMLQWIAHSTRCMLVPLRAESQLPQLATPWQYLLVSAAPEREALFQALKREHGSDFAFHGSPVENWHSILRNGLKNASGTDYMIFGEAHGKGIYLSPSSLVSAGYLQHRGKGAVLPSVGVQKGNEEPPHHVGCRKVELESLKMMAVCEVARHPSLRMAKDSNIWVAPKEETVVTRFFLIYSGQVPFIDLAKNSELRSKLHLCVEVHCSSCR